MKKIGIALAVLLIVAGGVFALENTVSAGVGAGFGVPFIVHTEFFATYELQIIPQLAVGINTSWQYYPLALIAVAFSDDFNNVAGFLIDAEAHFYPFGGVFHVDAGLGYSYYLASMHCMVITPGLGWKFKFSGVPLSFNLGLKEEFFFPAGNNIFESSDKDASLKPFNLLVVRLALGVTF